MLKAIIFFKDGGTAIQKFNTIREYVKYIDDNRETIRYAKTDNLRPRLKDKGRKTDEPSAT